MRVISRHALRTGVVCAVASLSLLIASPAFAATRRDDGDDPGESISKMEALMVFVGIPFGSLLLIWIACSAFKNPQPRAGHTIQGPPIWYGGPDEHGHVGGGHQDPALSSGADAHGGGGTSARY